MKNTVYFSQITKLAFEIDQKYYKNKHYVWCSEQINPGRKQPVSSNPLRRSQQLINDIITKDDHSLMIGDNKNSLKQGAAIMYNKGLISDKALSRIEDRVDDASNDEFMPIILIIPYKKVHNKLKILL